MYGKKILLDFFSLSKKFRMEYNSPMTPPAIIIYLISYLKRINLHLIQLDCLSRLNQLLENQSNAESPNLNVHICWSVTVDLNTVNERRKRNVLAWRFTFIINVHVYSLIYYTIFLFQFSLRCIAAFSLRCIAAM